MLPNHSSYLKQDCHQYQIKSALGSGFAWFCPGVPEPLHNLFQHLTTFPLNFFPISSINFSTHNLWLRSLVYIVCYCKELFVCVFFFFSKSYLRKPLWALDSGLPPPNLAKKAKFFKFLRTRCWFVCI